MEPHARRIQEPFHPAGDDPVVRAAQRERLRTFVLEYEAKHGPLDPKLLAETRAKFEAADAQIESAGA